MIAKKDIRSGRLELSRSEVEADIEKFGARIQDCRDRLSLLEAFPARERKRARRKLLNEIELQEIIKGYAQDALRDSSSVGGGI